MIQRLNYRLRKLFKNLRTLIISCAVRKSRKCILIGSWMGEKFADNSRFLFQYLHNSKKELGLLHVVWATRSAEVYQNLIEMGYETVLVGTNESNYWHYKCGIHILCNTQIDSDVFHGDIDTDLSAGAIKIQLWHGNGIKCVPGDTGLSNNTIVRLIKQLTTPGFWYVGNYWFLCKSDIDFDFFKIKFGVDPKYCIDSAYPRTCKCLEYYGNERLILNKIKEFKNTILFLPTFRKNYEAYVHPLENRALLRFLKEKNILWIEKPHSADKNKSSIVSTDNPFVLTLDSTFDINVLMPHIDLLVTDYSSAMLDAMYFRKQIVYYVPDYEYYIKDDRGFLVDYDSVCINPKVLNVIDITNAIQSAMSKHDYDTHAEDIRQRFWKHDNWEYAEIWESIINNVH